MNVCFHCTVFTSKTSPWKDYHFTSEWPFTAMRYVSRHMPICGCKLGVVAGGGAHLVHATTCLVPAHRGMRLFMCVYCVSLCPGSWADSLAGGICCKGAQRKLPRVRPVDHVMSCDFSSDCLGVKI